MKNQLRIALQSIWSEPVLPQRIDPFGSIGTLWRLREIAGCV
jgi:hypothetical protein